MLVLIALALVLTVAAHLPTETQPRRTLRRPRSSWELAASASASHPLR
jgi:hypothetical protein